MTFNVFQAAKKIEKMTIRNNKIRIFDITVLLKDEIVYFCHQ